MNLGDIGDMDPAQKAKLTTMLIEMRRKGEHAPVVKLDLIEEAKRAEPLPVYTRAERLLRYLVDKAKHVGQSFVTSEIIEDVEALAWSESSTPGEIVYFVSYLMKMSWLEGGMNSYCTITVPGYAHVGEQTTKKDLSQCFVAMWIDDSMKPALKEGIEKAVIECGVQAHADRPKTTPQQNLR